MFIFKRTDQFNTGLKVFAQGGTSYSIPKYNESTGIKAIHIRDFRHTTAAYLITSGVHITMLNDHIARPGNQP
jgi:hypothetical protein